MPKNQYARELFQLPPQVRHRDTLPAVRIALSVGIPLLVLLLMGEPKLTIFTAFGAFTALYGRNQPLLPRVIQQTSSGVLMVVCVGVGLFLSAYHVAGWQLVAVTSFFAAVCAYIAMILNLKPSGPLFYIFASAGIASIPYSGMAVRDLSLTAASAGFSLLLGVILGQLWGEGRGVPTIIRPSLNHKNVATQTLTNFITTLVAGLAGNLLGLSHAYWAMVAAAAVLAAPSMSKRILRGVHRMIGTILGVLVTAFFISMHPDAWHIAVLIVIAQFVTEIFVMRNYGLAAIFITPLALFMVHLASPFTSYELLTTRMFETILGAIIGMVGAIVSPSPEHLGKDTVAIPVIRFARDYRRR